MIVVALTKAALEALTEGELNALHHDTLSNYCEARDCGGSNVAVLSANSRKLAKESAKRGYGNLDTASEYYEAYREYESEVCGGGW